MMRTLNTTEAKDLGNTGAECFPYLLQKDAQQNGRALTENDLNKMRKDGAAFAVAMALGRINLPLEENAKYRMSKAMTLISEMIKEKVAKGEDPHISRMEYYLEEFRTLISTYPGHFKEVPLRWPDLFNALFPPTCPE